MPKIGRYEVQRELGRGAMGVVYLAHDPRLHRQVAVKTYTLPEGVSEEVAKEFHERFLREAQAAASLSHPGIVTIYDAGEDPVKGFPYIAMEFIPGQSLKQRLEKGDRLDPSWVLTFGAVLADALHLAHRAGIIHRDIKPANILIREGDGAAKIADFGVARLQASDLTQSGAALGSPGYMSPEQIRCVPLDGRSDLFSLAVLLYEALCGKRPFHGDDLASLVYSIAHDTQVPLSRRLSGCPAGLDRFFDRALSKDPEGRFRDGAAFKQAFLESGKQAVAHRLDQTVLEAATNEVAPAANQALRAGLDKRRAPAAEGRKPAGRGGSLVLKIAAVVLLSVGLAAAAYLKLGRPQPLKADDRQAHARAQTIAAGAGRQRPGEGAAVPQEMAQRRERALPPQQKQAAREAEPVPQAPRIPRSIQVTVPPGTEIRLTLDMPLGSSASHAGDTFTATITDPVVAGDRVAIPAGSRVHGRVSEAVPARKGLSDKAGSLSLAFDRVATPAGSGAPMSATMTKVAPKSTKKTAGIIGGSAAGGALLGKVLGGNSRKALIGSVVGGALGAGIAAGTKGQDVDLPAGSPLTIRLDQPLAISVSP